jgi:hypothetical protein
MAMLHMHVSSSSSLIAHGDAAAPDGVDPKLHREAVEAMDMLSDWPLRFLDHTFVFMLHQGSAQPQMETDDSNTKGDRETRTSDYLLQCALEVCILLLISHARICILLLRSHARTSDYLLPCALEVCSTTRHVSSSS